MRASSSLCFAITIHGEALGSVYEHRIGKQSDRRVLVPRALHRKLGKLVGRRGGPAYFGLEPSTRGDLYVDPGAFVEATLPLVTDALNAIMDATPVETLSDVDPSALLLGPPNDERFHPARRRRLRLLAGLT
jgi:hypothetical protein